MIETYFINVDVYNDNTVFERRLSELSAFRKEKTLQYRYRKDQNLSIGVGTLLDHCLYKLGIREKNVKYVLGNNGKPAFECNDGHAFILENVHFNVSHSGNIAICSWGTIPVGVDIEQIKYNHSKTITCNMLTYQEAKYLDSLSDDCMCIEEFYRIWTLKESFVKAIGAGLAIGFDSFNIILNDKCSVIQSINEEAYYFKEYSISGYKTAVCCSKDDFATKPVEILEENNEGG